MEWGLSIRFAHTSFKWKNLASKNAGVTVVVVGVDNIDGGTRTIFNQDEQFSVSYINPYLTSHDIDFVGEAAYPKFTDTEMNLGVYYSKSKGLILPSKDLSIQNSNIPDKYIKNLLVQMNLLTANCATVFGFQMKTKMMHCLTLKLHIGFHWLKTRD